MEQAEALQEAYVPEETQEEIQDEAVESEEVEGVESDTESEEEVQSEEDIDDQYELVDYEGNTYKLPPELKSALLRQSDYTQKTQEVAQQRKALEQQAQQFQQVTQNQRANMQGHAQLMALQSQLEQYANVDWNAASQEDPVQAQQAFFEYSQLKDATSNLQRQLQAQEAQALQEQRQFQAKRLEQGKAELARDIPNWSADMAKAITEYGQSAFQFTPQEMSQVADPRMVKVLHKAYLYDQSLKKATKPESKTAKPASKVRGKSRVEKDPDKMSSEEWLKWRNKQLSD